MEILLEGLCKGSGALSTLRLLQNLCPSIAEYKCGEYRTNLLELAFYKNCPEQALWTIVDQYP